MPVKFIMYRGISIREGGESFYDKLIDKLEETQLCHNSHLEKGENDLAAVTKKQIQAYTKEIGNLTRDLR